jgi:(E)-4-hydroxy-3-methylbut-2-enyl-diphosphate synthase
VVDTFPGASSFFAGLERVGHVPPTYVADAYRYRRRPTRQVLVGDVGVGGVNPIRVQSMTTTDTMDTEATVAQTARLVEVGCEIVRITAPTVEDARNLARIRKVLRSKGIRVPLVADIHFSPAAALEAAEHVEKVRINPGNFADSKRFAVREYTDQEYLAELQRIEERFAPLVEKCKQLGRAMRIGTNHGSLSDRIMNRFGDTPLGMVESALEFAGICVRYGYHDVIFSMKASNPKVMIQAYRLLAARLDELGGDYPFHLGVTEAGNGEDGRIKSAIGIGSLLEDGIGDTIRVSLTEDPELEVPVAFALAKPYHAAGDGGRRSPDEAVGRVHSNHPSSIGLDPSDLPDLRKSYEYARRQAHPFAAGSIVFGSGQPVRVIQPIAGSLSKVAGVVDRVQALAEADGLIDARPDAISVYVGSEPDVDALEGLQTVLDRATFELPLVVCIPVGLASQTRAVQSADVVSLSIDGAGRQMDELEATLRVVADARRPVILETVPPAAELDTARAASEAATRALVAAQLAREIGCRDIALAVSTRNTGLAVRTYRLLASRLQQAGLSLPLHLVAWPEGDAGEVLLRTSVVLGSLLCDGIGDSIQIMGAPRQVDDAARARLAFNILQAAGVRLSKTEYVACPSCGRTLFNLQETTTRIQRKTGHLKGVKLAIMGCIVNGPGEMADADFGYVGGAPGKVNLYAGKECVEKGVPEAVADQRLIELIRSHGKWVDPPMLASPIESPEATLILAEANGSVRAPLNPSDG